MTTSRRDFIGRSAAAYGALTLGFPTTALGLTPGHARVFQTLRFMGERLLCCLECPIEIAKVF